MLAPWGGVIAVPVEFVHSTLRKCNEKKLDLFSGDQSVSTSTQSSFSVLKSMKTPRWFIRSNSILSTLRITIAGSLLIAGMAMAFVAAKTSTSHAKTSASHFKRLHRDLFETSLGKLS